MPYLKDTDFVKLAELVSVTSDIAQREGNPSLIELTGRALAILRPYISEDQTLSEKIKESAGVDIENKTKGGK